jgi:CheY-like chemotaxis protein
VSEAAVSIESPDERTRVLFVDDEAQILEGLQDTMRRWRRDWDMTFVIGGALALEELERRPYDVVVSDMRMPGMDGATLLQQVQDRYPGVIRMILSGHSELESALRAAHVAHQFLAKPCDAAELRRVIDRTIQLRSLMHDEALLRVATGARTLPSVPACYEQLSAAINDPDAPVEAIGELIESDVAMCAKVLQLVNSAFFGLGRRIEKRARGRRVPRHDDSAQPRAECRDLRHVEAGPAAAGLLGRGHDNPFGASRQGRIRSRRGHRGP